MNIWIKVEVYQPKEGQCELIDRATIKRVVDRGDFRTIVFDFATLVSGEENRQRHRFVGGFTKTT